MRRESLEALGALPPRRNQIAELAGNVAESAVNFYGEPENQAYLIGCMVGAVMQPRMRFVPGLIVTMICGYAAKMTYRLADDIRSDIRSIADAAAAGDA